VDAFSQRRNRIAGRCPLVCASQRDTTSISGFARQESRLSHAVLKLPPSLVTLREPPSRRTMLLTEVRLRTIEPEVAFGSLASFWHAPPCLLVLPSLSLPPARVLLRHQPNPGREVLSSSESLGISNADDQSCCQRRTDTGDRIQTFARRATRGTANVRCPPT
jgi:hypothetical protein